MCSIFEVRELISSEAITGSSLFEGVSYSRVRVIQGNTVDGIPMNIYEENSSHTTSRYKVI